MLSVCQVSFLSLAVLHPRKRICMHASTKTGFTLPHAERAARFLCEAAPKVPEGCLGGFWHFWHPAG